MALGIYHIGNALKARIFLALYWDDDDKMTCKELAEQLRVPHVNIANAMNNYIAKDCGYVRRLKPEKGSIAYKYKLTKRGKRYLFEYCKRIYYGIGLNLNTKKITRLPRYYQIKQQMQEASERRRTEFEQTGIQQPEIPKPTLRDFLSITVEDMIDYFRLTKAGAVSGMTNDDIIKNFCTDTEAQTS